MATRGYIQGTIRFDNKAQRKRLKEAADRLHWSLNRLLLIGAERLVEGIEESGKTTTGQVKVAQLLTESEQLTLNQ